MLWLLLAIICAFFFATHQAFSKNILKKANNIVLSWASYVFGLPIVAVIAFLFVEIKYDSVFWLALAATVALNFVALLLFFKSIQTSPLSKVIPLVNLTPLFLIFTAIFIAGEFPSAKGILGILIIVIGAYLLNISTSKSGFFEPFKFIVKHKGSFYMLLVAFIWSFSASFDKLAINHSNPLFFTLCEYLIFSLIFIPIILKTKEKFKVVKLNFTAFIFIGGAYALMFISQMFAVSMFYVSYVVAIKRAGVLFSILFGWLFFKEKNIKESLLGAIVMVIGVFILAI